MSQVTKGKTVKRNLDVRRESNPGHLIGLWGKSSKHFGKTQKQLCMSSDHNIENCFAQVYNVSHRVFVATLHQLHVRVIRLPFIHLTILNVW